VGADIDHDHPDVRADLLHWGKWVTEELGTAGFRFDAVKVTNFIFCFVFLYLIAAFIAHRPQLYRRLCQERARRDG
jgi:hypothetical protein